MILNHMIKLLVYLSAILPISIWQYFRANLGALSSAYQFKIMLLAQYIIRVNSFLFYRAARHD